MSEAYNGTIERERTERTKTMTTAKVDQITAAAVLESAANVNDMVIIETTTPEYAQYNIKQFDVFHPESGKVFFRATVNDDGAVWANTTRECLCKYTERKYYGKTEKQLYNYLVKFFD